jgi:hypothetical protein
MINVPSKSFKVTSQAYPTASKHTIRQRKEQLQLGRKLQMQGDRVGAEKCFQQAITITSDMIRKVILVSCFDYLISKSPGANFFVSFRN